MFHFPPYNLGLTFATAACQKITKSALREFRTSTLQHDDVFKAEFYQNAVFYGSKKEDLRIEPDALDELALWNVKTQTFIEGNRAAIFPSGPYVCLQGKTWQPWRVYYDFNDCFMASFKPSLDANGR